MRHWFGERYRGMMLLFALLAAVPLLGLLLWLAARWHQPTRRVLALSVLFCVVLAHLIGRLRYPDMPWWVPWTLGVGVGILTALRWSVSSDQ